MTKNFCDMCGEPAGEMFPEHVKVLADRKWSGTKTGNGPCTDGLWEPRFSVRTVFGVENLNQNNYRPHSPDLCVKCMIGLLQSLVYKLSNETPTP